MRIDLYYTNSDNASLNKQLQSVAVLESVHPVSPVNVSHPAYKIGSAQRETVLRANYAYIADLHRYYYIEPVTLINNENYLLELSVDVLMSFKSNILMLPAIVEKSNEDFANLDYNDGSFINQEGRFLEIIKFAGGFNETASNILTVAGG